MIPKTERRGATALLNLYCQTGPFLWSQRLRGLGSVSPVRTVFIIGKCLSGELFARSGWHSIEQRQPEEVLELILPRAYELFAQAPIEPLPVIDIGRGRAPCWDPHEVLAELMAVDLGPQAILSARQRFRAAGLTVGFPELHDLSALFANVHLRGALRTFDPLRGEGHEAAWLSTVFYRYALRHVMASRRLEDVFLLSDELPDVRSEPQDVLERRSIEALVQALPIMLAKLPDMQREAVSLYFGFQGRERTIAEVASALSTNVYFARTALISGLGAIAASTGASGIFSQRELALARSIFLEGRSVAYVAEMQSTGQAEVRRQIAQVTGKLQGALRRRTSVPRVQSMQLKRESAMSEKKMEFGLSASDPRQYISRQTLSFRAGQMPMADWASQFSTSFVTVETVRELLAKQPDLLAELSDEQEELMAALYALQPEEVDRPDLEEDHKAWQQALDFAASQTLEDVRPLLELGQQRARDDELAIEDSGEERLLERLRDSMAAVAAALEQALPRRSRRNLSLLLSVTFEEVLDKTSVRWTTENWAGEAIPLFGLTRHRLSFVGGFKSPAADVFARCAVQILQERSSPLLPGFSYAENQRDRNADLLLRWHAPAPVELERDLGVEQERVRSRSDRE